MNLNGLELPDEGPVCAILISQVPNLTYLKVDRRTGEIDRSDPARTLHPNDREPVEAALRVKDQTGAFVVVFAVDNPDAEDGMREVLAMGADAGVLLSSQAIEHSDALARANLFAHALRQLPRCDAVFVGTETMEPDWSLVGGALGQILDWSTLPGGKDVTFDGTRLRGSALFGAERLDVEADLPAVVTVRPGSHAPRWATAWSVPDAYHNKPVLNWNLVDMEIDGRMLARMASLTETRSQQVIRTHTTDHEVFTDPPEQSGRVIAKRLARSGFLGGF